MWHTSIPSTILTFYFCVPFLCVTLWTMKMEFVKLTKFEVQTNIYSPTIFTHLLSVVNSLHPSTISTYQGKFCLFFICRNILLNITFFHHSVNLFPHCTIYMTLWVLVYSSYGLWSRRRHWRHWIWVYYIGWVCVVSGCV